MALPFFIVPRQGGEPEFPGPEASDRLFEVQAIDTMKHSRDKAREALGDPDFDEEIDAQMRLIREAGATHVAIGTPYDEEFRPVLERWVRSARSHGLSVWFRGNFSGWEGWFDYPQIGQEEHIEKLSAFIERNQNLFADGDLFSPCPECENGKEGDPREDGGKDGFNRFLREEHKEANAAFNEIGKDVRVVHSMNADVARDVLGKDMYQALDESLLVDHYVKTPERFLADIRDMRESLGEHVGIGEFGAPIPDLQGGLSERDQALYIERILRGLYEDEERVPIVNYWTLQEGTTAIVGESGRKKASYEVISDYFSPVVVSGRVMDSGKKGVRHAVVSVPGTGYTRTSDKDGTYRILVPRHIREIVFSKDGFEDSVVRLEQDSPAETTKDVMLLEK